MQCVLVRIIFIYGDQRKMSFLYVIILPYSELTSVLSKRVWERSCKVLERASSSLEKTQSPQGFVLDLVLLIMRLLLVLRTTSS
jgi:hypothetical protein